MKDLAHRNALERLAADGLVHAETVLINAAEVLAPFASAQMFTRITFRHAATGTAASAKRFPTLLVLFLPLFVSFLIRSHTINGLLDVRFHIGSADVLYDLNEFFEHTVIFFAGRGFNAAGHVDGVRLHGIDQPDHVL